MEALLKRFSEICGKYYTANEETGGDTDFFDMERFWLIGEAFADFSVTMGATGIEVFLPKPADAVKNRMLKYTGSSITIPTDRPDHMQLDLVAACIVMESQFDRIVAQWKADEAGRKAELVARLQAQQVKIANQLKELNP